MRTLIRELVGACALLWLVLSLTFVLIRLAPGDPSLFLVDPASGPAGAARLRSELGLDAPLVVQYARWAGDVLKGDLGESFSTHRPVASVLRDAVPISLGLGGASLLLTFLLGVTLGVLQGIRRGTRLDTTLTMVGTAVYAAPSFWLALALIALFTYGAARWNFPQWIRLPAFGVRDPASTGADLTDLVRHALLPVVTLTAIGAAGIARYARSIVADLAGAPFVRSARAKGLAGPAIYGRHLLANALPPLITLFALSLPGVLAGSVFVETVFGWPGLGRLMVSSIAARDYPVVMGATVLYAALVILANLCGDLLLPLVDPRRRQ
jgi:peptide/nickel transport system permease protein